MQIWKVLVRALQLFTVFALLAGDLALCQSDPTFELGTLPGRSFQVGQFDTVNTMNGNLMLHIPLVSLPQLGRQSLSFSLHFNSAAGFFDYQSCNSKGKCTSYNGRTPNAIWGFGPAVVEDSGVGVITTQRLVTVSSSEYYTTNLVTVTDSNGTIHPLGYDNTNWAHMRSTDGSGYLFIPATPNFYISSTSSDSLWNTGVLYDANGIATTLTTTGNSSWVDPAGNEIKYTLSGSEGTYTDTIGRSIPDPSTYSLSTNVSSCPVLSAQYQPLVGSYNWVVPGPNGENQTYIFCFASVSTSYETASVWTIVTRPTLQSIVLPDGGYWEFIYNSANPSGSGPIAYGELVEVITPQSGSISYAYVTSQRSGSS